MAQTIRLAFADLAPDWNLKDNFFTALFTNDPEYTIVPADGPDDHPDFVLCGTFGHAALDYACPRILYSGEDSWPDLNLYDYAIGFNHLDYQGRTLRFPLYAMRSSWAPALKKHLIPAEQLLTRKKFCSFVVSNDFCQTRNRFFELLSARKRVDSGGSYRNNIGGAVADKLAFQRDYKFSICFENSQTPGYLTEKLVDGFAAGTVPIYWGDPLAAQEFNPAAFLNAADYPTLEALTDEVLAIDADPDRWLAMAQAPILAPGSLAAQYVDGHLCREFLGSVFAQKGVLRRNQSCWGTIYESDLKAAYAKLHQPDPTLLSRVRVLFR